MATTVIRPDIDRALDEVILAAVQAALPPDVLAALRASAGRSRARSQGKAGSLQRSNARGRPTGVLRGDLRAGAKLNVIETLRAAAPWQALRRREAVTAGDSEVRSRILVRKDDFRITRFKQRSETTTIFVVDASGSAALHRLAEAKGAVELLLADCYVRRDQVALIAFRGKRRGTAVAADTFAGARQAQPCGLAGWRGHAACGRTRCSVRAFGPDSPQRTDPNGHSAYRWARQYCSRRWTRTSARGGRRDERRPSIACCRDNDRAGRYFTAPRSLG